MNNKFYYVYLVGGTIALILLAYQIFAKDIPPISMWNLAGDIFLVVVLFYLAFKTYHEKKDKEMM